jgi:tRNA threonylcarbamoyladenosine biosynthesis protein TsaE
VTLQDADPVEGLADSASICVVSANSRETRKVGRCLGALLRPGDLLLLSGPFGAGKTTLTQGIARGLGSMEVVTSPSFTLVNQYRGHHGDAAILYHIDLYRIGSGDEALDMGIEEYITEQAICVVEWPEQAYPVFPKERLEIEMTYAGPTGRRIEIVGRGGRYTRLIAALKEHCLTPTFETSVSRGQL